jgi:hypothetical protein
VAPELSGRQLRDRFENDIVGVGGEPIEKIGLLFFGKNGERAASDRMRFNYEMSEKAANVCAQLGPLNEGNGVNEGPRISQITQIRNTVFICRETNGAVKDLANFCD